MKKHTRIAMIAMSFCLVVALGVIGIFAVKTLNMSVGGNISFAADGILATISQGTMAGGSWVTPADANNKMQAVEVTTDKTLAQLNTELASWQGLDLLFNESGADVTITFTIKNNSTKQDDNIGVKTTVNNGTAKNAQATISPSSAAIAPGDTQTFVITFSVISKEINASLTNFNVLLKLSNEVVYEASTEKVYYSLANNYAQVIGYNSALQLTAEDKANIEIRSSIEIDGTTYNVTKIADYAFYNCSELTSISIPDSVTNIGIEAFDNCSKLTSVTIGNSVTGIGKYAFGSCDNLTNIVIPDSVTSIGDSAFGWCDQLTSVTIGNGVTSIEEYAFYNCRSLTNIVIPNSVTSIGECAFKGCSKLTNVTIGDNIESIGKDAFYGCRKLTGLTVGDNIASIGEGAFEDCALLNDGNSYYLKSDNDVYYFIKPYKSSFSLSGEFSFGSVTPKVIVGGAFRHYSRLTSITIPNSVINIGKETFAYCRNLSSIAVEQGNSKYHSAGNCLIETETGTLVSGCMNSIIPTDGSVTSIDDYAFDYCSNLTNIVIPNSVTRIGECAFHGCSGLTSIEIPDSVISIGNKAFNGCSGLTSVEIPDSVISIGEYAFGDCSGLTSIVIPDSITSIALCVFDGCSGLTDITLSNSINNIYSQAFKDCSGLNSITVKQGNWKYHSAGNCLIETQTKKLLLGCKNSIITTDGSVTEIYDYAFMNCSELTSISIPDSVTIMGCNVFDGCTGLTSLVLGNGLVGIEYATFYGCSALTSITIPDSVTSIGLEVFFGCSNLSSITIGIGLESMVGYVFAGCSGLSSITVKQGNPKYHSAGNCIIQTETGVLVAGCKASIIPTDGSVTSIGYYAFYGCNSLTHITIPEGVTSIEDEAFRYCGLTSIVIPTSITSIGYDAFYDESNGDDYCSLSNIYYMGSASEYQNISIEDSAVSNITPYYYSAERPSENVSEYWHYDESGNPTVWS